MAVLPTPAGPISTGLRFFVRHSVSTTSCVSSSRPTTAPSFPAFALAVRSRPNCSSIGVSPAARGRVPLSNDAEPAEGVPWNGTKGVSLRSS